MMTMYIATYIIDIVALLYLLGLLHNSNMIENYRKKPFIYGIVLTIIIILSESGTILAGNGSLKLRNLNIFCNTLGFAFTPIIPVVLIAILDTNIFQTHKLLLLPTLINIATTALSPSFGLIFNIDGINQYKRGNYFCVFVAVYIMNLLLLVISTLKTSKKLHYSFTGKMIALSLFTVAGTSIQLVYPSIYSSWHCITLSMFLYFLLMSEFNSSFDAMTGLYNRAAFEKAVKQMPSTKAYSVIVLDINRFKNINDTYGHDYGDNVIKTMAKIIRETLHYTSYRIGGDEFVIICNDINREKIEYQLRGMINTLAEERKKDSRLPTISYGYSICHEGKKSDLQEIIKEADDQMYHFKKLYNAETINDNEL